MNPHPLIHSELARQRQQQLIAAAPARRRGAAPDSSDDQLGPLVQAAASGDHQAWESLVERLSPTIRNIARSYRLNSADVDDVVQTCWTSALSNIGTLREPEAFAGWLCVIARRAALRTCQRRTREIPVDELAQSDARDQTTPETCLLESERRQAVVRAVNRLSGRQRTLVASLLRHPGASYDDISQRLGLPVGSIGPTRERALARLRRDRQLTAAVAESPRTN
jgi:RNA polymerase sigma factor (sigma-70 family)